MSYLPGLKLVALNKSFPSCPSCMHAKNVHTDAAGNKLTANNVNEAAAKCKATAGCQGFQWGSDTKALSMYVMAGPPDDQAKTIYDNTVFGTLPEPPITGGPTSKDAYKEVQGWTSMYIMPNVQNADKPYLPGLKLVSLYKSFPNSNQMHARNVHTDSAGNPLKADSLDEAAAQCKSTPGCQAFQWGSDRKALAMYIIAGKPDDIAKNIYDNTAFSVIQPPKPLASSTLKDIQGWDSLYVMRSALTPTPPTPGPSPAPTPPAPTPEGLVYCDPAFDPSNNAFSKDLQAYPRLAGSWDATKNKWYCPITCNTKTNTWQILDASYTKDYCTQGECSGNTSFGEGTGATSAGGKALNLCLYASTFGRNYLDVDPSNVNFDDPTAQSCKISLKPGSASRIAGGNCPTLQVVAPWCLASITKIPKVISGNVQLVEVKDLKDGDIIRTTRGDFPLSHIMRTTTVGPHTYIKFDQGSLGNNLPSQDLYITKEHSFSLGYYKNSVLNRNIHDPDQDDMVYLHITSDQLADKLPGVTRVQKEFDYMFNLVFDEHVSLDIYGLEVMMHHPKGNPYTLPKEKYQDKTKINNKIQKPIFANYGMLENIKPDHMEMKDFLRNCITANSDDKFRLEDVNHSRFVPPKTMLTEDLQKKLRVA